MASLEAIMREQGIDAAALFRSAGIDETFCSERSSSFLSNPNTATSKRGSMRGIPESSPDDDGLGLSQAQNKCSSEAVETGSIPGPLASEAAVSSFD